MIPITHPFRKVREKDGAPGKSRAGFLKEREKGRTPSCFTSTIQETRATLPALTGPTRQAGNTRLENR